jgi:diacylglycerol kinase (ATP)
MLDGKRVLVIVNPSSGRGKPDAVETTIDEALRGVGAEPTLRRTGGADDATEWAEQAADDGFDVVLVAGGDGTVTAAALGIVRGGHDVPLGVVPIGTGNGLARVLRLPIDPAKAIAALGEGVRDAARRDAARRRRGAGTDLLRRGSRRGDQPRRRRTEQGPLRIPGVLRGGRAQHVGAAQPPRHPDHRRRGRGARGAHGHAVQRRQPRARRHRRRPDVDPHDGQLDVAVLRNPGFWQSAAQVLRLVSGPRGLGELRSARRVRVEAEPPLLVHADGDVVGSTPLEVEIVPAALTVIAAQDYRESLA